MCARCTSYLAFSLQHTHTHIHGYKWNAPLFHLVTNHGYSQLGGVIKNEEKTNLESKSPVDPGRRGGVAGRKSPGDAATAFIWKHYIRVNDGKDWRRNH
jgi:hypothetical protein